MRVLAMTLLLGGGLSLVLHLHGARWWYAPLGVVAIIPAHVAVLGGIVLVGTLVTRGRRAHGGTTLRQEGGDPSAREESLLLHKPRQFDRLARLITLGREGKFRRWTLDLAAPSSGDTVLDVGCGTGTLLLAAAERVGPPGILHGVEPSAEMAAYARQKAEARGIPLEIREGSADSLPYPPMSFDAVLSTLVFHHLPPGMREAAISEMRRVLRPGAPAVIVDWQQPTSFLRALLSPMFLVYLLHNFGPSGSPADLMGIESLMRELGFEHVTRHSFGSDGAIGAVVGYVPSMTPGGHPTEMRDPGSPLTDD